MKLEKKQAKETTNKTKTEILAPHDNENFLLNYLQWGHQCQHGIKKQNLEKVKQAGEFAQCIPRSASHTRKFGLGTDLRQRIKTPHISASLQPVAKAVFVKSGIHFLPQFPKKEAVWFSCKLQAKTKISNNLRLRSLDVVVWRKLNDLFQERLLCPFFFPQRNLYSRTHSHIGKEIYCPVPGAGKIKLAKTFEKGDKQF